MTMNLGLLTDGTFSAFVGIGNGSSPGGGGGIIYRERNPTKKECEKLYFPKIYADLEKVIAESRIRFILKGIEIQEGKE